MSLSAILFGIALLLGSGSSATGQMVVPNALACPQCRIEFNEEVNFAAVDGPGALVSEPSGVARDSRGRYWLVADNQMLPAVFDAGGSFLRVIGRRGQGPGEFEGAAQVVNVPGDSILIIDLLLGRANVVTDDFRVVRTIALPTTEIVSVAVVAWPNLVILNATVRTADRIGWPLHLIDMSNSLATIRKSFGHGGGELRGPGRVGRESLVPSPTGGIWAAEAKRYRVSRWSNEGNLHIALERRPKWFSGLSRGTPGGPTVSPHPLITGVLEDEKGRVWVFCLVAKPNWADAWREAGSGRPTTGEFPASSLPAVNALYDTMVEVLDPEQKRLVASRRIPRTVIEPVQASDGIRALSYAETSEGVPTASVLTFRLKDPIR
jgi:hypothetical protein